MTTRERAYRATGAPAEALESPLARLSAAGARVVTGNARARRQAADDLHLPVAAARGVLSSFDEVGVDPDAVRVCVGTSCLLSGGSAVSRELGAKHKCHPVYCLGYCDRAPAVMTPQGKVVLGTALHQVAGLAGGGEHSHPAPPSIRCTARHAVVTERIGKPRPDDDRVPPYDGLAAALRMQPEVVLRAVIDSGVKGRGGAAYPTGRKWQLAAAAQGQPKFVVANGDEGDPGSFIDRELMERDPHAVLEGMAVCAHAIGASRGIVFIRAEYPEAAARMTRAIERAVAAGTLGDSALGNGRGFRVEVVRGMGSYVCGEETALLAAIEGRRGEVSPRPPFPVEKGLFGLPTVVDNVETLVNVAWIARHGAGAYSAMGTADSKGTKALCFNRGFERPGIVEVEFGVPLREAVFDLAGGGAGGAELEAVLLGGPMGSIVTPDQWDVPVCFTAMSKRGINLGHGGLVAIHKPADWGAILRHLLTFMKDESCGKCVPCRLGSARAHEMAQTGLSSENLERFNRIMALMKEASLCAFGRETPGPVRAILDRFGDQVLSQGTKGVRS